MKVREVYRNIRELALAWFGIVGMSLTLISSLEPVLKLAKWCRLLVEHWSFLIHALWNFAFSWLGIDIPHGIAHYLTTTMFIIVLAISSNIEAAIYGFNTDKNKSDQNNFGASFLYQLSIVFTVLLMPIIVSEFEINRPLFMLMYLLTFSAIITFLLIAIQDSIDLIIYSNHIKRKRQVSPWLTPIVAYCVLSFLLFAIALFLMLFSLFICKKFSNRHYLRKRIKTVIIIISIVILFNYFFEYTSPMQLLQFY